MILHKPLDYCYITQPFGVDWIGNNFYKNLGLKGHSGIDFRAITGTPFYAVFDGTIDAVYTSTGGGLSVRLLSEDKKYCALYVHLDSVKVKKGQTIFRGDELGKTDNTGKYTTGAHLHFALYPMPLNKQNGYKGAIDPYLYFPKNFDKLPVDLRYNQPRRWWDEWKLRFKNSWIHRQLISRKRKPLSLTNREVSALVYGYWDWHSVMDPAMFGIWSQLTKPQYESGEKPPVKLIIG